MKQGYPQAPFWMPARRLQRRWVPPELRSWLFETSSLTRRLQQCGQGQFSVRVLQQSWCRPLQNERRAIGMPDHEWALIRQVQLLCGQQPVVYARTAIPVGTLRGAQRRLAQLGDRPLGALLFADKSVRRGPLEVARISSTCQGYVTMTGGARAVGDIWGRRSLFHFGSHPLLVSEVFLPAIVGRAHWR